jgi:16S rRNA (guanine527-N7)-methyltransferase
MTDSPKLLGWLAACHLEDEIAARLLSFARDLLRFNRTQNLISRKNPVSQINTMIWEAVAASELLPSPAGRSLDLGSGAGFPGIPLAILCPTEPMDLLERRGGRCEFLRRELLALQIPRSRVLEAEASELAASGVFTASYSRVWLKAVAEPSQALSLAAPFLTPGGTAIILRDFNWIYDNSLLDSWDRYERIGLPPEPSGSARPAGALHLFHS